MTLLPGFGGGPSPPAAAPPPPTREDPAIQEAKNKLRRSELTRKGRRAAILTSGNGLDDSSLGVAQPKAGAKMLGG
tara:strand:+ start:187 stop:414 length:228 start_codon:yes stop_codon:yes gene_type:complete